MYVAYKEEGVIKTMEVAAPIAAVCFFFSKGEAEKVLEHLRNTIPHIEWRMAQGNKPDALFGVFEDSE